MAENQTQPNPQFIFWVKEAGVFRPAELKMPEDYIGYDLRTHLQLGAGSFSPDALILISSPYLGPIKISEETSNSRLITKEIFQRKRDFEHSTIADIVGLAEKAAKNAGVPYFSLTCIQSPVERTWEFKESDDLLSRVKECYLREDFNLEKFVTQPQKPVISKFILHPTAHLYVKRE